MNKTARNERRKLTAGFFNAIASGTILAALVAPFIGLGLVTVRANANMLSAIGLSAFGVVLALVIPRSCGQSA